MHLFNDICAIFHGEIFKILAARLAHSKRPLSRVVIVVVVVACEGFVQNCFSAATALRL